MDLVASDGGVAIIDIRPLKEKSAVGTPDVPSSARGRFLELEVAEIDRRLRGQLRNVDSVESQVPSPSHYSFLSPCMQCVCRGGAHPKLWWG